MEPAVSSTRHCRGYMFNIKLTTVSLSQSPHQDAGEFSYLPRVILVTVGAISSPQARGTCLYNFHLAQTFVVFENINLK